MQNKQRRSNTKKSSFVCVCAESGECPAEAPASLGAKALKITMRWNQEIAILQWTSASPMERDFFFDCNIGEMAEYFIFAGHWGLATALADWQNWILFFDCFFGQFENLIRIFFCFFFCRQRSEWKQKNCKTTERKGFIGVNESYFFGWNSSIRQNRVISYEARTKKCCGFYEFCVGANQFGLLGPWSMSRTDQFFVASNAIF